MLPGRDAEFAQLDNVFARMREGRGSVVFLTGEAGLGKTTLVHDWWRNHAGSTTPAAAPRSSDAEASPMFLEAACSIPIGNTDVGRLEALQPWIDIVAQLDADAPGVERKVRQKLDIRKLIADCAPAWAMALLFVGEAAHAVFETHRLVQEQRESSEKFNLKKLLVDAAPAWAMAVPVVGEVAHAALETHRLVQEQRSGGPNPNPAAQNQQQVFQQYVNLITKVSADTPLVMFLDDCHWADASSCNLLFYLARQIAERKILVIATYRLDDALQANSGKGHPILTIKNEILRYGAGSEQALSHLDGDAIVAVLRKSFPSIAAAATTTRFVGWLSRISSGNALFVTQFIETLKDDGHFDDRGNFIGNFETIAIPASALAVVEERTRRLDEGTRRLLMYATAEGEEFTAYVLERISRRDPMELLEELQRATQQGLVTERGRVRMFANTSTAIFGFSHALFHKALYDQLLEAQKEYLHRQCFELLKAEWDRLAVAGTRTTTLATKLLTHAEKCEEWEVVAEVALATGQEIWATFNEDEAMEMITRTIAATAKMPVNPSGTALAAEATFLRGEIDMVRGRSEAAVSSFRAAEEMFRSAGKSARAVDAVNSAAWTFCRHGVHDDAIREAERAAGESRAIGHPGGEARAVNTIGTANASRAAFVEAEPNFDRALALFTSVGDRHGEASALNNLGLLRRHQNRYDEALAYHERSLALFASIGNRRGEADALLSIGVVHICRGEPDRALASVERSLDTFRAIGSRNGEASALGNMGFLHMRRGDNHAALRCFEQCLEVFESIGSRHETAKSLLNLGNLHERMGDHSTSIEFLERARTEFAATGDRRGETEAMGSIGAVLRELDRLPESRDRLERALEMATGIGDRGFIASHRAELARTAMAQVRAAASTSDRDTFRAEAVRLFEEAARSYDEVGDVESATRMQQLAIASAADAG